MGRLGIVVRATAIMALAGGAMAPPRLHAPAAIPALAGDLSVLTYNIHGLPWPVASGRPADLAAIGQRLRDQRAQGRAPHVVVLQEAFTDAARSIGAVAGYRYIADGPSREAGAEGRGVDLTLASTARWWSGETVGKWVGSGLQILSDYPIVETHAVAYPNCAGYDCLANKGALLVGIAVPGMAMPIDILDTHLNSRRASGVASDRSDAAYRDQMMALNRFVGHTHDPRRPLIVAGDFNVGRSTARRDMLLAGGMNWRVTGVVDDALHAAQRLGMSLSTDAQTSLRHAKDWQFFAGGTAGALSVAGIAVPFGHAPDGTMLSDHIGYIASYRVMPSFASDRGSGKNGPSAAS